jgi:hypothetical protein
LAEDEDNENQACSDEEAAEPVYPLVHFFRRQIAVSIYQPSKKAQEAKTREKVERRPPSFPEQVISDSYAIQLQDDVDLHCKFGQQASYRGPKLSSNRETRCESSESQ